MDDNTRDSQPEDVNNDTEDEETEINTTAAWPRPKNFFTKHIKMTDGASKCTYVENGVICNRVVGRKSALRHFQRYHPQYESNVKEAFLAQSNVELRASISLTELTRLDRLFTQFVATSTCSLLTLTNNEALRSLLQEAAGYKIPCRQTLAKRLVDMRETQNQVLLDDILSSPFQCSLTIDIATTRSMRQSYLGITCTYINKDAELITAAINLSILEGRHTGLEIRSLLQRRLSEYGIPTSKIMLFNTDNDSAMASALREGFDFTLDNEPQYPGEVDSDLNALWEEIDEDEKAQEADEQLEIYPEKKHIKCAAHTIQLLLKDVFEQKESTSALLRKRILAVISSFRRSHVGARELYNATGLNVRLPATTRWSFLSYVYSRVVEISGELNKISAKYDWGLIEERDIREMRQVLEFATPLHAFNDRLQATKFPTISLVYPGILHFKKIFEEANETNPYAKKLLQRLELRFKGVIESGEPDRDPLYLVAAYLDRSVTSLLSAESREKAKKALVYMAKQRGMELVMTTKNSEVPDPLGLGRTIVTTSYESDEIREYELLVAKEAFLPREKVISFWAESKVSLNQQNINID